MLDPGAVVTARIRRTVIGPVTAAPDIKNLKNQNTQSPADEGHGHDHGHVTAADDLEVTVGHGGQGQGHGNYAELDQGQGRKTDDELGHHLIAGGGLISAGKVCFIYLVSIFLIG